MSEVVVDLSRAFAPAMSERRRGAILTVSSAIGLVPMARYATYGATRAFCVAFGDALHTELRHRGVAVTTACPGGVESEFFAANGPQPVEAVMPRFVWRTPEQVARSAIKGLSRNRRIVVPGAAMRAMMTSSKLIPRSLMLSAMDRLVPTYPGPDTTVSESD
jgi:short-subunit dehydrogenase